MVRHPKALAQYRAKRSFDATPEPRGSQHPAGGGLYVIQKHDARRLHYDLRLELDGTLKSWAVTKGPSLDPSVKRLAVHVEDHPIDYATFEGTIPAGNYGAGTVIVWDRGTWEPLGDARQGLKDGKLAFRLNGERLKGRWALVRMHGKRGEKRENWLLIKELDDEVDRDRDILAEQTTSVATGRDLEAVAAGSKARPKRSARKAAKRRPPFAEPQLATLVDEVPAGGDWLFEMKFDGFRLEIAASGADVRLYTRSGQDWTERFSPIARAVAALDLDGALIDGEVVVLDEKGVSDFGLLQGALDGAGNELSFFAFDLLADRGEDLRSLPLRERKARLRRLFSGIGRDGPLYFTDHVEGDGLAMFEAMRRGGFEGVIAKRADDTYHSGRSRSWLKIKCGHEQEFIIVGFSPSERGRPFSSIVLALREKGKLRYAGRVGSGFGDDDLGRLAKLFAKLERKTPPVMAELPRSIARRLHWLEPKLVAAIAFAGFTRDDLVRQGRFLGLREDKAPRDVHREVAEKPPPPARPDRKAAADKPKARAMAKSAARQGRRVGDSDTIAGIRLTHPDKVLFPQAHATKRDLAAYYQAIAPRMMPHIEGRLVSLVRAPDGAQGETFFQRHVGATLPKVFRKVPIKDEDGKRREYMMLNDASGLVACAQFGALEIHVWGSHADRVEKPDRIVFDLDPDEGLGFDGVAKAAFEMRDVLEALGLKSYAMITGGKGLHVIAPITRRHGWDVVGAFASRVAERMVEADPARFVATMSKAKRKGKIFIDHFRNRLFATAISPYSSRAKTSATIACPLSWEELRTIGRSDAFTIRDLDALLARTDPWAGYFELSQGLTASARQAVG